MIKKTEVESHIAFIRIPKPLIYDEAYKGLSLTAKFMYGLLYNRLQLSLRNKWYDDDGYVYQYYSNDKLVADLSVSEKTVIKIKKELAAAGLLKEVRQGINLPNKLYLSAVTGTVTSSVQELENLPFGTEKKGDLELEKVQGNKTEYNKTNNNIVQEVVEVIAYLNEKTGSSYRASSQTSQKLIKARLKEGYELADFKQVIDVKVAEWLHTSFAKFLRPATLFGNKFESYVNQALMRQVRPVSGSAIDERLGF